MTRLHLFFILLWTLSLQGIGQDRPYFNYALETIDSAALAQHAFYLSSNELQGREAGYEGQKLAAAYIAQKFKASGIKPLNGAYFQKFHLDQFDQTKIWMARGNDTLYGAEHFISKGYFKNKTIDSFAVTYLGYGIHDSVYSNYKNIEVAGKWIVIKQGLPGIDSSLNSTNFVELGALSSKIETARKRGVKGIIVIDDQIDYYLESYEHYFKKPKQYLPSDKKKNELPVIEMTKKQLNSLFGKDLVKKWEKLDKKFLKDNYKYKPKYQSSFTFQSSGLDTTLTSENVLGFIPSEDKDAETIVLTAHYDHLGVKHGKVFNGADDNASGTSALILIAQALMEAHHKGWRPNRNILIMPVSAEEKGLIGSRYYTRNPIIPLEETIACLNVDMIGRIDTAHTGNSKYIYVIGSNFISQKLHEINEAVNKKGVQLALDYSFNTKSDPNQFYYRSDHYNFAEKGIPSIFFFSGVHEDYHKSTDTFEKLDIGKMTFITEHLLRLAWELANSSEEL